MEERAISTNGPRTMRYTGEKAKTNQPINKIQHSFFPFHTKMNSEWVTLKNTKENLPDLKLSNGLRFNTKRKIH